MAKKVEAAATSVSEDQPSSKKRKREELDESDPKLKEFLEAMHPGQRPKRREDLEDNAITLDEPVQPAPQVEAESDDEYETIPARPRQTQNEEGRWPDAGTSRNVVTDQAADPVADPVTDPEPQNPQQTAEQQPTQVRQNDTTDDEWLRSRTNRLLDLVDADDPNVTANPSMRVASPEQHETPAKLETKAPDEGQPSLSDEGKHDEVVAETTGEDSALELLQKTARLFVRNLPYSTTEDDLRVFFEAFGSLEEVSLTSRLIFVS